MNLAVSGDSPSRQLLRMAIEAEQYHPDWILNDASILDPSLEERHLDAIVHSDPMPTVPLAYVAAVPRRSRVSAADSPLEFQRKIRFELKALLDGAYGGWSEYSRRTGVPLTVLLLPRTDEKGDNPVMTKLIHVYVRRYQLECLDLSDAFGDLDVDEFRLSPWDKHPSVLGHRLIFEALSRRDSRAGLAAGVAVVPLIAAVCLALSILSNSTKVRRESGRRSAIVGRFVEVDEECFAVHGRAVCG